MKFTTKYKIFVFYICISVCALHIRQITLVIHTALLWRGEI